jgi:hypothetical protein
MGNAPEPQLYDLAADIGQRRNLAGEEPDTVARMAAALKAARSGESTRPAWGVR